MLSPRATSGGSPTDKPHPLRVITCRYFLLFLVVAFAGFFPVAVFFTAALADFAGFFIAADQVVTNCHVVKGASTIRIKTYAGKTSTVRIIITNEQTDLALLKVENREPEVISLELDRTNPIQGASISSQLCSPPNTSLMGPRANLLFGELSKCEMTRIFVPLGIFKVLSRL